MDKATIDIIYTFLKNCEEYRSEEKCQACSIRNTEKCKKKSCKWYYIPESNGGHILWGVNYLLGQILRQVHVPPERKHLSTKAIEKWNELGLDKDDIWEYNYQDWVPCTTSAIVDLYKGASRTFESKATSETRGFVFRAVFHDEHIVPIHDILAELFKIPKEELTHDIIHEYLNKIHICRMLKSEDKEIKRYNRGYHLDYLEIYRHIYKPKGIEISEFDEIILPNKQ